ncbi:hypothetical protein [Candidatus Nitrotoga sp. 1052]|uniref:hypothetical protein n=1 Tax=Candidatus Nitrotoga sp. 1052 TaxID=2886964 RepID=UPI001EF6ABA6|nr:hypothetical protein [Candidatus Nitrotoga sp. 1052]
MNMLKIVRHLGMVLGLALTSAKMCYAVDSYRFLHVHIDTLWYIFLFLLGVLFVPFILMAVLTWHYAESKADPKEQQTISVESEK